jgi:hypothetical protein
MLNAGIKKIPQFAAPLAFYEYPPAFLYLYTNQYIINEVMVFFETKFHPTIWRNQGCPRGHVDRNSFPVLKTYN